MNRTTLSITALSAQCVLCIDTTDTISDVGLPHSNVRHKRVQDVIESLPIPEQYITPLNQSTANNHQVSLVGVHCTRDYLRHLSTGNLMICLFLIYICQVNCISDYHSNTGDVCNSIVYVCDGNTI